MNEGQREAEMEKTSFIQVVPTLTWFLCGVASRETGTYILWPDRARWSEPGLADGAQVFFDLAERRRGVSCDDLVTSDPTTFDMGSLDLIVDSFEFWAARGFFLVVAGFAGIVLDALSTRPAWSPLLRASVLLRSRASRAAVRRRLYRGGSRDSSCN